MMQPFVTVHPMYPPSNLQPIPISMVSTIQTPSSVNCSRKSLSSCPTLVQIPCVVSRTQEPQPVATFVYKHESAQVTPMEKVTNFKCQYCCKYFSRKSNLQAHIQTVHEKQKNYRCEWCNTCFTRNSNLKAHILNFHNKKKTFKCDFCNVTFSTNFNRQMHIATAHLAAQQSNENSETGGQVIKQEVLHINLDSSTLNQLSVPDHKHFMAVPSVEQQSSEQKSSEQKSPDPLSMAQQSSVITVPFNGGRFKCKYCTKCFSRKNNLNAHITTVHEKIKNFKCDLCGTFFTRNNNLKAHIANVHRKVRDFKCDYCGKCFVNNSNLQNHIAVVHFPNTVAKCDQCGKRYRQKASLDKHILQVHAKLVTVMV